MHALREPQAVVAWVDYHRSRVRLSRAMALYLPVTTWCGVVGLARLRHIGAFEPSDAWVGWSALLLAWAAIVSRRLWMPAAWRELHDAPHTKAKAALVYAQTHGYGDNDDVSKRLRATTLAKTWASSPVVLAILILLARSLFVAASAGAGHHEGPSLLAVAATGAVLSGLAARTWWRISITYRAYLRIAYETSLEPGVDTPVV